MGEPGASSLIECELTRIVIRESSEQQYIFLRERNGNRSFPILIGLFEAAEINRKVTGVKTLRPLTHDLLRSTLDQLGGRLVAVEVDALRDNTFFAKLVVQQNGEEHRVDCRPSDAIALAVAENVPISVAEQVIEAASRSPE